MDDGRLEAFGTRAVRLGLGLASLGLGALTLARALGWAGPLAAWDGGLGAVPAGEPLGIVLAAVLLVLGAALVVDRGVPYAVLTLAVLLIASLALNPPATLGAIQDLGLLGAALGLFVLPSATLARLPLPLARLLAGLIARRRLALRIGLALVFLLAGWGKFANTDWYVDLPAASGGVAGWPLVGGVRPTALVLYLGAAEIFLSGLLVWGPPARLASALAAVVLLLDLLALRDPSLIAAKTLGLLGAAIAGYCWASGATALENAQIGWLRAGARGPAPDAPGAAAERD
jgi:uncharacterized membrane protein YphA (DoxX/SURF4 family)